MVAMVPGCKHDQTDGTVFFNGDDDSADKDNTVGYGDDGGADNSADRAEKHLVHCPQVADLCWEGISKGDANDNADKAEKHLKNCAQVADHYWEEISKG
eukprot:12936615-Ditylum_brightwellii.AAC.1